MFVFALQNKLNVIDMVTESDKLMGSFTNVRSSECVVALTNTLMDSCLEYLSANMVSVFKTQKFNSLGLVGILYTGRYTTHYK